MVMTTAKTCLIASALCLSLLAATGDAYQTLGGATPLTMARWTARPKTTDPSFARGPRQWRQLTVMRSSKDDFENSPRSGNDAEPNGKESLLDRIAVYVPSVALFQKDGYKKLPPMQVEDMNVLLYDIFLLTNLSSSISFWVTHRMSFEYLGSALGEGCLLSIFWILSGLYHGSFLMSAVDGHYGSTDERGGPKAAAVLALNTFISAVNFRLLFALAVAFVQHRPVGMDTAEQLIPLEIACGLVLMCSWRTIHSAYTPR